MKKVLAIILASLMILTMLAACANGSGTGTDTTPSAQTEDSTTAGEEVTEKDYPEIPEGTDLKEKEFCILYYDSPTTNGFSCPVDIWAEAIIGESLTDSVYMRNKTVEDKLNVKITMYDPGKGKFASSLRASTTSGDNLYQMADINVGNVITMFNQGSLKPASVLGVDYSKPWYDQKTNDQMTLCGKQIAFAPATLYIDKLETVVTFYNAALGADLNIGSLYDLAQQGGFTLDFMLQYAAAVSADLNHDGKMDQNDAYCISSQNDFGYYNLLSAGISSASSTKDSIVMNLTQDKTTTVLQKTTEIMENSSVFFNRQSFSLDLAGVCQMFGNKQALFLIRPLHTLYELRNYDQKFEILPTPKFNADQENYSTPVNHYAATIFCVPAGFTDYSDIGLVSDVLAAESYYTVLPVFYDVVLDYKLVNDPRASKMLDIAFETRKYDLGCIFGINGVQGWLVAKSIVNIGAMSKSIEKSSKSSIEKLITSLQSFN